MIFFGTVLIIETVLIIFYHPKADLVQYLSKFLRPFQPYSYDAFSLNIFRLGYWTSKLSKNSVATLAMARKSWHNFDFLAALIIETVLIIFNDQKFN